MAATVEIDRARPADLPTLLELWGDLAAFHAGLDPAFAPAPHWRSAYEAYLLDLMHRDDARVLVARVAGTVVAFAVGRLTTLPPFFADRRRGYIQDVVTHPRYRRRGIATRLVEHLLAWMAEEGIATVELTVAVGNPEAMRFWERLGFRVYMHQARRQLHAPAPPAPSGRRGGKTR
ncbi:MAG: GNAT family N-acetyltransferase [Armatimonadota bacterium]|nr:GNAT family N-acetyltransferase [Armatimonadota bacterium]MDR7448185.1 GNAT family N-acetyltransferase [Armatimonadota bacterium]MDR7458882.1 GNAT family N-acetyltransferase [Armatimonadota bacterium]MDR7479168.1 GNAT family N-acetyltransferase [Armatimonadota bacterium]MDR7487620.1 GNAT family N-acetyltransferase [Armatimonadota bacterium]